MRTACGELGLGYVVEVRSNHQVTIPATKLRVTQAAAWLPKRAWQRMRTGAGQKGVRDYDWGSTWRRRHQHRARLCHRNWHTYADTTP
ncbi:hypothetical protein [Actinacidiphila oryziradicis]|uniref:Uncharacterized protein n=1 Tax=Actinacidiphila oryziradicis TaxID=2571141 RepID=A0A4U0RLV7_9ACTN|nr:hypothetical protein [Actinacidiphila oryziradicis]TJZ96062.1 hypothetical protein FCI23_51475 [Actinacidiphila oryziradicis]